MSMNRGIFLSNISMLGNKENQLMFDQTFFFNSMYLCMKIENVHTLYYCRIAIIRHCVLYVRGEILFMEKMSAPSGQNLADSVGNLRGFWLLAEGIHMEIWVVSETRIRAEIQGKFLKGVKMRGMTSNHHWDTFT